jgi:hypothetical protein
VLRFWLERGVDGFRVDVLWHLVKDADFADNPPNPNWREGMDPYQQVVPVHTTDRPEVHEIIRRMRSLFDEFHDRVLIGEIYLPVEKLVQYYGVDLAGAHLPFNFQLINAPWDARHIAKMIADYESEERDALLDAPRQYAITQQHKHLKEMKAITGLENAPIFCPIVSDFYSGMMVTVPLFASQLRNGKTVSDVKKLYADKYNTELVSYKESVDEAGFVAATAYAAKDTMTVSVAGNEERILLIALYDNLGKGASGAAVECMNIALGAEKTQGLDI